MSSFLATSIFEVSRLVLFLKRNYDPVGLAQEKVVQVLTFFARLPFLKADSYGMFTMNIHFSLEKATCQKFRIFDYFPICLEKSHCKIQTSLIFPTEKVFLF